MGTGSAQHEPTPLISDGLRALFAIDPRAEADKRVLAMTTTLTEGADVADAPAVAIGIVDLRIAAGDPPDRVCTIHAIRIAHSVEFDPSTGFGAGAIRFGDLSSANQDDLAFPRPFEM